MDDWRQQEGEEMREDEWLGYHDTIVKKNYDVTLSQRAPKVNWGEYKLMRSRDGQRFDENDVNRICHCEVICSYFPKSDFLFFY